MVKLRSAGGVVVRQAGDHLRVALMRSTHSKWVFPKGRVNEGEALEQTARREIAEEIGLRDLALLADLGWTEYDYTQAGKQHRKRVHWFLFRAAPEAQARPRFREGSLDCGWFQARQALSLLSYPNDRRLLRKALSHLAAKPQPQRSTP
jgi:8-oxo-dGTP pyrophosphatase MutT (NUDIX family)